jgi:hypothetical protein
MGAAHDIQDHDGAPDSVGSGRVSGRSLGETPQNKARGNCESQVPAMYVSPWHRDPKLRAMPESAGSLSLWNVSLRRE